ncbi:MAG: glutaredoxin family protein [Candidatus Bipolaricaulia bacterium]
MKFQLDFTGKRFAFAASGLGLVAIGLILYFLVFTGSGPDTPAGQLAVCLNEQGVTMYGLPTCPHCQEQKDKFGDSFKHVNYVNCSENRDRCLNQGIETVPTWIIDGEKIVGVQELEELAEKAGCEYP